MEHGVSCLLFLLSHTIAIFLRLDTCTRVILLTARAGGEGHNDENSVRTVCLAIYVGPGFVTVGQVVTDDDDGRS